MAVLVSLGGNSAGDGFRVAPVGSAYEAGLSLSTDAGTIPGGTVPENLETPGMGRVIRFHLDGVRINRRADLDERGRAAIGMPRLKPGAHKIRATCSDGGKYDHHSSSSPNLLYTVGRKQGVKDGARAK